MKTAAIYCRVSTEDQEREGTSLETQREACLAKAQELGYEVLENSIFIEAYSGLTLDRPQLTTLRNRAKDGEIQAIIVHTPDRLCRVGEDILSLAKEFKVAGVKLQFVKEQWEDTLNGKLVAFMLGWASEFEAAQFKERSIRGKRARAAQGRLPSGTGRKLYGYDYMKGKGIGEGIRYVNEAEAKWVRQIFAWLVEERLSINGITRRLRALNIPTPGSEYWLRQTVYRILTNIAYTGKTYAFTKDYVEPKRRRNPDTKRKKTGIIWKPKEEWVEIADATPAIISQEMFDAAQERLKRNKQLASPKVKREYLLSGYLFCSRCKRRYIGYVKKWKDNGKPNEQRYYRCGRSQSIVSPDRCDNKQLNAPHIERIVWDQIEVLLSQPELVLVELQKKEEEAKKYSQQFAHWQSELQGVEAKLRNIEKQKDRAWKAFEITGDENRFRADIARADEDKATLEEQKAKLEQNIIAFQQCQVDIEGIKQACYLVKRNLKYQMSFEDKRLALEALQIRVTVDGDKVNIEGSLPLQSYESLSSASKSPRQRWLILPL